jgi:hypothetical protein
MQMQPESNFGRSGTTRALTQRQEINMNPSGSDESDSFPLPVPPASDNLNVSPSWKGEGIMKSAAIVLTATLAFGLPMANASTRNAKTDIRVVPSSALPEMAQQASQDLLLHDSGTGTPYLYLEQKQGARLAVFDVSEPAHIRLAASVDTGVAKSYDFVQPVTSTLELIRFRDGSGSALLNLQKAKAPRIENLDRSAIQPIEMLGDSGYLAVALQAKVLPADLQNQDVQVIDSVRGSLLATVEGVTRTEQLSETGTVFLLGSHGLTVVRRLDVEQQHDIDEMIESHN